MSTVWVEGIHYRQEFVKCGRNCKKCPHGPYWYAYWWDAAKLRKAYVGKKLPDQVQAAHDHNHPVKDNGPALIFMSSDRAWELLGMKPTKNRGMVKAKVAGLLRRLENGTGIAGLERREVEEAWFVLSAAQGWK